MKKDEAIAEEHLPFQSIDQELPPPDQQEAPEPSAGGPMSGEAQLSAAPAESIQDVKNDGEVLEVQEDELVDPVIE